MEGHSPPTTQGADSYRISKLVANNVFVNRELQVLHKHGASMESICEIRPDKDGNGSLAIFNRAHEVGGRIDGGWDGEQHTYAGGKLLLNFRGANGWWTLTSEESGQARHFKVSTHGFDFAKP
jgi:hypothetical protein